MCYTKFYCHYFLIVFSLFTKTSLFTSSKPKALHEVLLSLLLVSHPLFVHSSEKNIKNKFIRNPRLHSSELTCSRHDIAEKLLSWR